MRRMRATAQDQGRVYAPLPPTSRETGGEIVRVIIGLLLMSAPFVAMFGYIWYVDSLSVALSIYSVIAIAVSALGLGIWLATS